MKNLYFIIALKIILMKRFNSAGRFNLVIAFVFIILLANCAKEDDKPELDYSKVYLVKDKIIDGDFSDVIYHYEYDTKRGWFIIQSRLLPSIVR